jgi:hypothetical protein
MKFTRIVSLSVLLTAGSAWATGEPMLPAPNGIQLPANYKNWKVIGTSHREDNQTLRVIVGNDVAVKAARAGKTNPWPEGSVLGKLVWKDEVHPKWAKATVPGEFVHAEFMIKDSTIYQGTGGWGFARWIGMNQTPYGKDSSFVQECMACHVQVKDNDSVFTRPAPLP